MALDEHIDFDNLPGDILHVYEVPDKLTAMYLSGTRVIASIVPDTDGSYTVFVCAEGTLRNFRDLMQEDIVLCTEGEEELEDLDQFTISHSRIFQTSVDHVYIK